jgi:hypothetical protein
MLPQPPPNAPAPPISEEELRSRRYGYGTWIVGVLSIIGLLIFAWPTIALQRIKAIQTHAVSSLRQMGLALYEFECEYGKFPDASTISAVKTKTGTLLPLGNKTSNDYFRQLLASGIAMSESMFYAEIEGTRKPDERVDPPRALEKGECGFAYFMGTPKKPNQSRPLATAPMIPGTDRFDPKPFDGRAVLLKWDNSVTSLPIDKNGHVIVDGKNLFDPTNPIWDGKPPVIVWPEL